MADRVIQTETLQNIANAIRDKGNTTDSIAVSNFATAIENIDTKKKLTKVHNDLINSQYMVNLKPNIQINIGVSHFCCKFADCV